MTAPIDERPLGALFSELGGQMQDLVQQEMALAKAEVKEQAVRAGRTAGLFAGAGVAGFVGLLLVAMAVAWGLAEAIPAGLAFLAVGLVFVVAAGLLFVQGRTSARRIRPVPTETVRTLRDDIDAARSALSRGAHQPTYDHWRR
jgi:CHASE3 domain sensor protein